MEARLNIITLGVKDLPGALAFYENGLCWKRSKSSQDNIIFFPLNGIVLALYPRDLLAEDATVSPEGKGFNGISLAYNTRSENEVNEIIEKVKRLGAEIIKLRRRYSGEVTALTSKILTDIFSKWPTIPFLKWMKRGIYLSDKSRHENIRFSWWCELGLNHGLL